MNERAVDVALEPQEGGGEVPSLESVPPAGTVEEWATMEDETEGPIRILTQAPNAGEEASTIDIDAADVAADGVAAVDDGSTLPVPNFDDFVDAAERFHRSRVEEVSNVLNSTRNKLLLTPGLAESTREWLEKVDDLAINQALQNSPVSGLTQAQENNATQRLPLKRARPTTADAAAEPTAEPTAAAQLFPKRPRAGQIMYHGVSYPLERVDRIQNKGSDKQATLFGFGKNPNTLSVCPTGNSFFTKEKLGKDKYVKVPDARKSTRAKAPLLENLAQIKNHFIERDAQCTDFVAELLSGNLAVLVETPFTNLLFGDISGFIQSTSGCHPATPPPPPKDE
ncbi:Oidioi.mRNA.OKI2018_I69.chr1.g1340.t1.cds [Oikopleura dioica]|uniref:Oidioi.mRNA.OKI2018_I69.chr1.g1340.t1.cds n=1 Tax=Oikopleura dioica TaxID=34765 RepID=A0ABN7SRW0_OIKDI|nr:Oidioi.mRNA.OKI2018_I69.chr1.g1340.t1.cds [Oikopleura dioica]